MDITGLVASVDLELGFWDIAPEPIPECDHPGKLDGFWVGVGSDVEFVPFGLLV
jgi:hypothetical protein